MKDRLRNTLTLLENFNPVLVSTMITSYRDDSGKDHRTQTFESAGDRGTAGLQCSMTVNC